MKNHTNFHAIPWEFHPPRPVFLQQMWLPLQGSLSAGIRPSASANMSKFRSHFSHWIALSVQKNSIRTCQGIIIHLAYVKSLACTEHEDPLGPLGASGCVDYLTAQLVHQPLILDYHFIVFPFFLHEHETTYLVNVIIWHMQPSRFYCLNISFFTLNQRRTNSGTYRAKVLDTLLVQLRSRAMFL